MPKKPLQFYAVDMASREKVVLKFYPWPYTGLSNCIAKYERLRHSDLVCRYSIPDPRLDLSRLSTG